MNLGFLISLTIFFSTELWKWEEKSKVYLIVCPACEPRKSCILCERVLLPATFMPNHWMVCFKKQDWGIVCFITIKWTVCPVLHHWRMVSSELTQFGTWTCLVNMNISSLTLTFISVIPFNAFVSRQRRFTFPFKFSEHKSILTYKYTKFIV